VHERNGLAASILGHLEEVLEVSVVGLLLTGQVKLESLAGEETVEALAEIDMGLSVKENPVVVSKKLRGNVDDCRLDISGRVEDLASHITGGSNDNEPKEPMLVWPVHYEQLLTSNSLVEDRNAAERTAAPLGMIAVESRVHGVEEGADEGNLHGRSDDRALSDDIGNYTKAAVSDVTPDTGRRTTYFDHKQHRGRSK
jgi:hypothetical protein